MFDNTLIRVAMSLQNCCHVVIVHVLSLQDVILPSMFFSCIVDIILVYINKVEVFT